MQFTRFKELRLKHNVLQVELAQRADIDRCRLSLIENGHLVPRPDELERIARALGVSIELLAAPSEQQ